MALDGTRSAPAARASVTPAAADRRRRLQRAGRTRRRHRGAGHRPSRQPRGRASDRGLGDLTGDDIRALKLRLVRVLAPLATAVMLDEEYGGHGARRGRGPAVGRPDHAARSAGLRGDRRRADDDVAGRLLARRRAPPRRRRVQDPAAVPGGPRALGDGPGRARRAGPSRPATRSACRSSSNRSRIAGRARPRRTSRTPIAAWCSMRSAGWPRSVQTCSSCHSRCSTWPVTARPRPPTHAASWPSPAANAVGAAREPAPTARRSSSRSGSPEKPAHRASSPVAGSGAWPWIRIPIGPSGSAATIAGPLFERCRAIAERTARPLAADEGG